MNKSTPPNAAAQENADPANGNGTRVLDAKPAEKPPAKTVTIRGKVVDDATGNVIGRLIVQGGKFDPADPKKVTWGFTESRSGGRDGTFSTTVRWADGWTARMLADGYIPQPVLTTPRRTARTKSKSKSGSSSGPKVRGVVLDHTGKPLKDAAVFALGPTAVNLAAGKAIDNDAEPVRTDAEGRFRSRPAKRNRSAFRTPRSMPGLRRFPPRAT